MRLRHILAGALAAILERYEALWPGIPLVIALQVGAQLLNATGKPAAVPAGLLLILAAHVLLVIRTSRVVLLGSESVPRSFLPDWGARETRFILYVVMVAVICMVGATLASALASLFTAEPGLLTLGVALAVSVLVVTRCSLLFPAVAVDHKVGLGRAWLLSRRHQLGLPILVVVVPVLLTIPGALLLQLGLVVVPLVVVLNVAVGVYAAALLAVAYHEILRIEEEASSS